MPNHFAQVVFFFIFVTLFGCGPAFADSKALAECYKKALGLTQDARQKFLTECREDAQSDASKHLIPQESHFRPDSQFVKAKETLIQEFGTLDGVGYRIYKSDGSGAVQGDPAVDVQDLIKSSKVQWSVACKKDAMTDKVTCSMSKNDFYLFVDGTGKPMVSIGTDNFPGKAFTIRIGTGDPISATSKNGMFDLKTSQRIVGLLTTATSFKTRYVKWPYDAWIDVEYTSFGFNVAYEYIKWAASVANKKPT